MLIQPSVQSAYQTASFTSSVSATGVEQSVVRAPVSPVDASSRDAGADNSLQRFQAAVPGTTPDSSKTASSEADAATPAAQAASANAQDQAQAQAKAEQQKTQQQADQVVIDQLKARDQEVRLHEAAHAAVGGQYAGAPSYQFQRGPDGNSYAVGGEVSISTSAVKGDPQATIEKARVIRAAALAPAQPSDQDRSVAALALQLELEAQSALQQQRAQENSSSRDEQQTGQTQPADKSTDPAAQQAARQAAAKEAAAREAAKQEQARQDEAALAVQASQASPAANPTPGAAADNNALPGAPGAGQDQNGQATAEPAQKQPNALERLEKILLGPTDILVQANQNGVISPQNPYGKSGYLDIFA